MHFSGIGLLLVAYGALAWHFSPHMGDDGFIFYRYASLYRLLLVWPPIWSARYWVWCLACFRWRHFIIYCIYWVALHARLGWLLEPGLLLACIIGALPV